MQGSCSLLQLMQGCTATLLCGSCKLSGRASHSPLRVMCIYASAGSDPATAGCQHGSHGWHLSWEQLPVNLATVAASWSGLAALHETEHDQVFLQGVLQP